MAERPIIFSGPMVRALLAGRKTQTRRKLKLPSGAAAYYDAFKGWRWLNAEQDYDEAVRLPFAPGDRLWVREAWAAGACAGDMPPSHLAPRFWRVENGGLWYRADGAEPAHPITPRGRWRTSIHMPRWASRLTLGVTDVRVQRLQEISEEDARAEGCPAQTDEELAGMDASGWFRDIWESIHGPDAWSANPWVVAVSFRVEQGGADDGR